jgi:hypothetical protein
MYYYCIVSLLYQQTLQDAQNMASNKLTTHNCIPIKLISLFYLIFQFDFLVWQDWQQSVCSPASGEPTAPGVPIEWNCRNAAVTQRLCQFELE